MFLDPHYSWWSVCAFQFYTKKFKKYAGVKQQEERSTYRCLVFILSLAYKAIEANLRSRAGIRSRAIELTR